MNDPTPPENPFRMKELGPGGPYTLGPELCSSWKSQYLSRANKILASYSIISSYCDIGQKHLKSMERQHKITESTPFRFAIGKKFIQCDYGLLKRMHRGSITELSKQAFLMTYGNLEAYMIDIVCEALRTVGCAEPEQEALKVMARTKWEGKIDAICQRFKVSIGKKVFFDRYKGIPMEFVGKKFSDPIAFLQQIAEIRHLLVHSAGRVTESFVDRYPDAGLKKDAVIEIPSELPFEFSVFLIPFVDIFDKAFADVFRWERYTVRPEHLIDV